MDEKNKGINPMNVNVSTGVSFEDNHYRQNSRLRSFEPETPRIIRLVMKLSGGLIKSEKQANVVLVVLASIMLIVSFLLFFS